MIASHLFIYVEQFVRRWFFHDGVDTSNYQQLFVRFAKDE